MKLTLSISRLEFLHFLEGASITCINSITFLLAQSFLQTFVLVLAISVAMHTANKLFIGYMDLKMIIQL